MEYITRILYCFAQNYTAKKMNRANQAYRYTLYMMGGLGVIVTLAFMLVGEEIFSIFIPEKAAYEAGGKYLFIMGFSQIFMMTELTMQGMFNGVGKTSPPAIVSIVFNTLRIPLAIFLASRIGVNGVWWAITISSIIKGIILPTWFYFWQKRKKKVLISSI